MPDFPRREICELLARYQFEPTLRDIFVEGESDRQILAGVGRSEEIEGVEFGVYEVDVVNVPPGLLASQGLTDGAKQRVIALAVELSGDQIGRRSAACIVDKDLDQWLDKTFEAAVLRYTKYCDLEGYFIDQAQISELLRLGKSEKLAGTHFFRSLLVASNQLFAIRLAFESNGVSVKKVDIDRSLKVDLDSSTITFDAAGYLEKVIQANAVAHARVSIVSAYHDWLARVEAPNRNAVRGHDLIEMLAFAIRKAGGGRELGTEAVVERFLIALARGNTELRELLAEAVLAAP